MMDQGQYAAWWDHYTDDMGELRTDLPEPTATLAAHIMALQERIDALPSARAHAELHGDGCRCFTGACACAYDHPGDVCSFHL